MGRLIIGSLAGYLAAATAWIAGASLLSGLAILSLTGAAVVLTLSLGSLISPARASEDPPTA